MTRKSFLEFLKMREQKRQHQYDEQRIETKRDNLLARRFVLIESLQTILAQALQGVPYAIIGGHAVVFHGRPRTTDDIDILVPAAFVRTAVQQLGLQNPTPLTIGGYSGTTPNGVSIDVISPTRQKWLDAAIDASMPTKYGRMISAPFLIVLKMWASRGSHDDTDMLGILKNMNDQQLNLTRTLVKKYLPSDADDLESLISMRNY